MPDWCEISSVGWKISERHALDWKPRRTQPRREKRKKTGGPGRPRKNEPETPKDSAQTNFTDSESRIVTSHDGFIQGYNAQAVVDGR